MKYFITFRDKVFTNKKQLNFEKRVKQKIPVMELYDHPTPIKRKIRKQRKAQNKNVEKNEKDGRKKRNINKNQIREEDYVTIACWIICPEFDCE